jgi:hypothetical protein
MTKNQNKAIWFLPSNHKHQQQQHEYTPMQPEGIQFPISSHPKTKG